MREVVCDECVLRHAFACQGVRSTRTSSFRLKNTGRRYSSLHFIVISSLGARLAVNYRRRDFAEVLRAEPGFQGVDLVLDMVGRDYLDRNLDLLRWRGRIVFVSLLSGSHVELNLRTLMVKRLSLVGTTLRQRDLAEKASLRDGFLRDFGGGLAAGEIRPVIDGVFPIVDAEDAHRYMEENRNIGKIVLQVLR